MTLSIDDSIVLQELARRTWPQILVGLDEGDAAVVKVVWWAARRACGDAVAIDSPEMNPRWTDFTMRAVPHLTQAEPAPAPPPPAKPAAKPAPKKPSGPKR